MHWKILKSLWQSVAGNKLFTVITVGSLSLGVCAALLAGAYINRELSFDAWLPGVERILRLETNLTVPGQSTQAFTGTYSGLRPEIESVFGDDIEASVRIFYQYDTIITASDDQFSRRIAYSDPEIFQVLPLRFLEGDPERALARPDAVVLTENFKTALLGEGPALGEMVVLNEQPVVIRGVVESLPYQSHLSMEVFASIDSPMVRAPSKPFDSWWGGVNVDYYLRAVSDAAAARLKAELVPQAMAAARTNMVPESFSHVSFEATPVTAIHMRPARTGVVEFHGNPTQLVYLGVVAFILLAMAGFNYVLLSLARAFKRAREVGIRKAIGGSRGQLFRQYIGESAFLTALAVVIAYALAELLLPFFANFTQSALAPADLRNLRFLGYCAAGTVLLILAIGSYPALYLSGLQPGRILKGLAAGSTLSSRFMKSMTGAMFTAAVLLTVVVTIMFMQFRHIATQDLGYTLENLYSIEGVTRSPAETVTRVETIREQLRLSPAIEASAASSALPYWDFETGGEMVLADGTSGPEAIGVSVGFGYFDTYRIPLLAGRAFSPEYGLDRTYYDDPYAQRPTEMPVVVTMETVRALGLESAQAAIDAPLRYRFTLDNDLTVDYRIVGVVPDIQFRSLYNPLLPMFFVPNPGAVNSLSVRIVPGLEDEARTAIESAWKAAYPDDALNLNYVANELGRHYQQDRILLRVIGLIAGIAITLAALGLYGLIAFDTEKRRKEIGIRKALGALPGQIIRLIITQFTKPLVVAAVLAWPLAWYASRYWLEEFAYRITLSPAYFISATTGALGFVLMVIWFRAAAAAAMPPVEALREE